MIYIYTYILLQHTVTIHYHLKFVDLCKKKCLGQSHPISKKTKVLWMQPVQLSNLLLLTRKRATFLCVASGNLLHSFWTWYLIVNLQYLLYLVGGFNHLEKYWSVGVAIPNIWENKIHVPNHQPDRVL